VDEGAFEFQGDTNTDYSTFSLTFPPQKVGTTSSEQDVGIGNQGPVFLQIAPFIITGDAGDYTITDNCHNSHGLPLGTPACGIAVHFAPTARGGRPAQITIISNDAAGTKTITLSGLGIAGVATLAPTSLTFTSQLVGTTSGPQPVTLSNTGDAPLNIDSIIASGDFGQSNNCTSPLAPTASCTINVTFTPTLRGMRNGAVTISDSAAGSPHVIGLQGSGIGPAATLSPGLSFTGQLVGTTSASQPVTLSSVGETALSVNSISATGDFGQTNNCPASLPNGQNCTIQVTFTPTARGMRSGTLSVADNSTSSPEQVSLSGTGTAPVAASSRTSLAFGSQILNVPASNPVILSNTGDATLAISSIAAGGDFNQTNDCGASLAPLAHCTITVTFQPTAVGARLGSLTFTDSAADSPQTVSLSGTGVQLGLSATSLAFGNQISGTNSAAQMVTVTNLGSSALNLTSIVASAGFTETNTCGTTLAGNASCTVTVVFAPTAAGPLNGLITISYNGTQSTIALSGNGTDFSLAAQQGGSTTDTISAGGTATYNLSLSGSSGFNGTVSVSCSGAPAAAACSVNPSSEALNGTTPVNFSVTVTTTARSLALPVIGNWPKMSPPSAPFGAVLAMCVAGMMLAFGFVSAGRKRKRLAVLGGAFAVLVLIGGCGGGSTPPHVPGTPAGTSTITVTATSGGANRTLNLTLNVN
jgi:hypothetical protein